MPSAVGVDPDNRAASAESSSDTNLATVERPAHGDGGSGRLLPDPTPKASEVVDGDEFEAGGPADFVRLGDSADAIAPTGIGGGARFVHGSAEPTGSAAGAEEDSATPWSAGASAATVAGEATLLGATALLDAGVEGALAGPTDAGPAAIAAAIMAAEDGKAVPVACETRNRSRIDPGRGGANCVARRAADGLACGAAAVAGKCCPPKTMFRLSFLRYDGTATLGAGAIEGASCGA